MQHVGKLICSNLGARMDSEPKRWRVFGLNRSDKYVFFLIFIYIVAGILLAFLFVADVLYDAGTGLEVLSPLCPQLFLEMAGLGNFAKV